MFDAGMRTKIAQRLVSIVGSVFDQICFNRLDTHFNISMFGHQTMFDGVWSPNISRLSRPLGLNTIYRLFIVLSSIAEPKEPNEPLNLVCLRYFHLPSGELHIQ